MKKSKPQAITTTVITDDERRRRLFESRKVVAEDSLYEFVKQAWHVIEPETVFVDNWHIKVICEHLEATSVWEPTAKVKVPIEKLLINVPPGTMKSLLVCVFWPCWVWTKSPVKRFMFSSYNEALGFRDSMKRRDLIASEWYQERWPLGLREDQNAKGRFDNDKGGWCIVGSIKGKGIGEHPDFNVGDDPHNVLEAESEADRLEKTRWFEGVFCVRGVIRRAHRVLVMQRLHALDCSGVALSKGGWIQICLPMRYERPQMVKAQDGSILEKPRMPRTPIGFQDPRTHDGELLWPAKYPEDVLADLENSLGLYGTAGQMQQSPSPRGGGKFKRVWFEIVTELPRVTKWVRFWDKAGTQGGTGAETSSTLMGTYTDESVSIPSLRQKFIIVEVDTFREQAAYRETIIRQKAINDQRRFGHVSTWVEQEPGSGGLESAQSTVGNLQGFSCQVERVTGSKEVRADPMASAASVGKVKLLLGDWNEAFLAQLEQFPVGKLKDMVDSASGAFNKLALPGENAGFMSTEGLRSGGGTLEPDALTADDLSLTVE